MFLCFKGTVSVISSDPPCKDDSAGFTTVPFKVLSDQVLSNYILMFITFQADYFNLGSLTKVICAFTTIQENVGKRGKTTIFHTLLITLRFQGYRCEAGIAIFAWRVTLN